MVTIQQLRKKYLLRFPSWEEDVIFQHSLKKNKEFILTHPEYRLNLVQLLRFFYVLTQIKLKIPLAYITHNKEFFELNFFVNKHTLIPRPETEIIVEQVITLLNGLTDEELKKSTLVDVGTGSGCIPISILEKSKKSILTYATDISKGALKVAKKNAKQYHFPINFLQGNLLEPISRLPHFEGKIIISANLPYLTAEQYAGEPSIKKEPFSALVAKEKGLKLYRNLFEQISFYFPGDVKIHLFLEIDPSQHERIDELARKNFSQYQLEIKKDLAGRDRVISIEIN